MAIKALNLAHTERFVSKFDPEYSPDGSHGKDATGWMIGTLSSVQRTVLQDDSSTFIQNGGLVLRHADNDMLAARMALRGWDNFDQAFETEEVSVNGNKWPMVTVAAIAEVPFEVVREIGQYAKMKNKLSAGEEKNSGSPSSLSKSSDENGTVAPAVQEASGDGAVTQSDTKTKKAT